MGKNLHAKNQLIQLLADLDDFRIMQVLGGFSCANHLRAQPFDLPNQFLRVAHGVPPLLNG
ncbi:hypothetical protein EL26_13905 [Tumebacillus flagellatus]|uniref:Uncharacterized protein n=1 Tax=Tumebacillus flagellatus TaxID=1157490 RepID=A0A074LKK4_9BACL|nr:hypothetical protein EL26_13905 [Tumebacillus flagellatus]